MNPSATCHPFGNLLRRGRPCRVVKGKTAAELFRTLIAQTLVVDDHQSILGTHLVRVPSDRNVYRTYFFRIVWVGNIDQRRAAWRAHMANIKNVPVNPDLPAAGAVDMSDQFRVQCADQLIFAFLTWGR